MKKIRDSSAGPPPDGLWRWKCPETGYVVTHSNFPGIRNAVLKYLRANNYPVTSTFEDDLEQNICAHMDPRVCEDFIPPTFLAKMTSAAQALYGAAKEWRKPVVSEEVLQQRREICQPCNFYGGSTSILRVGCKKCGCTGLKLFLVSSQCPISKW